MKRKKAKIKHDKFCANYKGPCCPWMGDCTCQCTCKEIKAIRKDERKVLNKSPYEREVVKEMGVS